MVFNDASLQPEISNTTIMKLKTDFDIFIVDLSLRNTVGFPFKAEFVAVTAVLCIG